MGDERRSCAEVREVGSFLIYESSRLQLIFAPEKKRSLVGMIRAVNTTTKRNYFDRFNLTAAPRRKAFIKEAVTKIELSYGEIEALLDQFVEKLTQQSNPTEANATPRIEIPDVERQWGESFLKNKNLVGELLDDFKTLGCVGEETNLLTCYLVATSRLLEATLAAVIASQSGAGKSMILNTVMRLIPGEELMEVTRMTPTALYYQPENRLRHKLVALGEEVGAEHSSHALRCLLSDGHLRNLVTTRDPRTGQMSSQETMTQGPTSLLTTTTVAHLDEETQNRFLRLAANESLEQTREILRRQRESRSVEALEGKYRSSFIEKKHHAAQRLLRPLEVRNPFVREMTFREDLFRLRREQEKYLRLIDAVALLRQQQKETHHYLTKWRPEPVPYLLVSVEDIELANQISEKVLSLTLDELTPPARNLLVIICEKARRGATESGLKLEAYRFTRREIRAWSGWSDFQVRRYIKELENLEYLKIHRGSAGLSYEYELVFYADPEKETRFNLGLVDVAKLREKGNGNGNGSRLVEMFSRLVGV